LNIRFSSRRLLLCLLICQPLDAAPAWVAAVQDFLLEQATAYGGEVHVEVFAPAARFPECVTPKPFLPSTQPAPPLGRVSVGLRCANEAAPRYLSAQVAVIGQFLEAAVAIAPGTVITPDHLRLARGDLGSLPPHTLRDPGEVLGKLTRRRLAPGTVLQSHHLDSPPLIERGETVNVESGGAGFRVRRSGEALESAALGEKIRVRLSPREVIVGVVSGAGEVSR